MKIEVVTYDMDISKKRRPEALEIVDNLFGAENVAHLCTFNSLSPKVAIKDLGKVFNEKEDSPYHKQIPYSMREKMANLIPKDTLVEEALEKSGDLRKLEQKFPLLFEYAKEVQNAPKSVGCHASAVIIADEALVEHSPIMYNKDGRRMLQVEMGNAEYDLKLVKFDFLGLISLDTVNDTLKLAGLTWDDVDLQKLNLDDKDVLNEIYGRGDTLGVFQMESYVAQNLFKDIKPDTIEDVFAVNAINRPAILSVGMQHNYIKGKHQPDTIKYINEDLKPIFSTTNGIMLYQEQALKSFRLAGFPEDETDNARRAIGKKKADVMASLYDKFHDGLKEKGWTEPQVEALWELIKAQAEYSFNRAHK